MADPENKNDGTTLYVANLGYRCVDEDLEERFNVFGEISSMELMKDPVTRESRGFAFITYRDSQDAKDAQRKMDGANINGRSMRVEFSRRKRGHPKTPGFYAGPVSASRKYGSVGGFDGGGGYGTAITIAGVMTTLGIETMMIVEEIMMIAGGDIEGHTSCSVFRLEYNKSRIYLRSLLPQQNNVIFTD
eukprot:CAMPEP_0117772944 /NCGR_PEP_ID=MMETSP0947-20121206/25455_1 /TAXON_ID=44440 /ORGANISM="Chattonella subsalsa, Strain CCMP2191" /LENGTH=188 /DNA_ID=CAMNT_0005598779 /DNA_START=322 /DNA_END=888 /DNA_ORIENTATION=+